MDEKRSSGVSDMTIYDYQRWYNKHLKDLIGGFQLGKITPRVVTDVYNELRDRGVSDDLIHRLAKLMGWVLDSATRRMIIPMNPASCVPVPKKGHAKYEDERDAMTKEQLSRFMEVAGTEPLYWRTIYGLLIATGMRREELVALRWENVLGKDYIRIDSAVRSRPGRGLVVKGPKSAHSRRKYAMTDFLSALLTQWNDACGGVTEGYLFPSAKVPGNPVFPDTVTNYTIKMSKKLGLDISPHDFRHVFITVNRAVLGVGGDVMKRLVGHADDNVDAAYMDSVLSVKRRIQTEYEEYLCLSDYFLSSDESDTKYLSLSGVEIQ